MENYKLGTRERIRYQTNIGLLSIEQLWTLKLTELDNLAVELQTQYLQSGKKTFLTKTTEKDKLIKLKFDIVVDILNTLKDEATALSESKITEKHNEKIINLIAEKQEELLKKKPIKELEALLKK